MLAFFQVRRRYHSVEISISVDVDKGFVSFLVKNDRRITATWETDLKRAPTFKTPEACEAWIVEEIPVTGLQTTGTMARIEAWHHFPHMRPARIAA